MSRDKKHIAQIQSPSKTIRLLVAFALAVFINFTFAIQYINWSSFNITITEIVEEEEEKEEHKNDIYEALINNSIVIRHFCCQLKEVITEEFHSDVLTPPPEFS